MRRSLLFGALASALLFSLVSVALGPAHAQVPEAPASPTEDALLPNRPIPYPVTPPPAFERAIENGTRTPSGAPGPNYWTNTADYTIDATLSPATRTLRGTMTVEYQNNAPNALQQVAFHLRQNLHKQGATRNRPVQITGGLEVSAVEYGGQPLVERTAQRFQEDVPGYVIRDTRMFVTLPDSIPSGGSATFAMSWSFEVPASGAPRMGQDGEAFYLGYWYPQLAVYDDLEGWVAEPYQGDGEFYMGYGSYDVSVTLPDGWLVGATGTLQNPGEVLSAQTRERLAGVTGPDSIVTIVGPDERAAGTSTRQSPTGTLTWRFSAENVRDFAFGASDAYVWDATLAETGDADDGSARIHALYRPDASAWDRGAEFGRFSIEHLSDMIMPYPYPHMTLVEGIIGGGMEYPMITLIGGNRTYRSLFGVTYHEISHMWFPMVVGTNEKRYTWMDEGTTTFNTAVGEADFFEDAQPWLNAQRYYMSLAGTGYEEPPMRHADNYTYGSPARGVASYTKPGIYLHALRGFVGDEAFFEAYRAYADRWAYKHPTPHDLFNTFEDVLGRDLDWFWTSVLYETWTVDHAVADVADTEEGVRVTIADEGRTPLPVLLRVTYADGSAASRTLPVGPWLQGARTTTAQFPAGDVLRVEIDPQRYYPDTDRSDNTWTADSAMDD